MGQCKGPTFFKPKSRNSQENQILPSFNKYFSLFVSFTSPNATTPNLSSHLFISSGFGKHPFSLFYGEFEFVLNFIPFWFWCYIYIYNYYNKTIFLFSDLFELPLKKHCGHWTTALSFSSIPLFALVSIVCTNYFQSKVFFSLKTEHIYSPSFSLPLTPMLMLNYDWIFIVSNYNDHSDHHSKDPIFIIIVFFSYSFLFPFPFLFFVFGELATILYQGYWGEIHIQNQEMKMGLLVFLFSAAFVAIFLSRTSFALSPDGKVWIFFCCFFLWEKSPFFGLIFLFLCTVRYGIVGIQKYFEWQQELSQ